MTVIATLPPTTLPAGPGSIKPQVDIPIGSNQMLVKMLKIGWPGNGQLAGYFTLAYTANGVTIPIMSNVDVYDVPDDANPMVFPGTIPDTLNGHRRLVLSWNLVVAGLQMSGTIEANIEANTVALKA